MLSDVSLSSNIKKIMDDISNKKDIDINFEKLISIMESRVTRIMINQYLEFPKELDDEELNILSLFLQAANMIYSYSGESTGLTDSEYDLLVSYYNSKSDKELPFTTSIVSNSDTSYHKYKSLRGTLDKIYKLTDEDVLKNKSQKSIEDWIKSTKKRYTINSGSEIDLMEEEVIVMPKFDGVSCIIECDKNGNVTKALTRGNVKTNEAEDITDIIKKIYHGPFKKEKYPYGIKSEIMVLNEDLKRFNEVYVHDYKSTRSVASSIINSDTVDERVMYLNVVPLRYEYLKDGEESMQDISPEMFNYPTLICKLKNLEKIRAFAFTCKSVAPGFRCDGAVICFTNPKIKEILGREDDKNKYEVAYKFTEETAYSMVTNIKFTTGLFGKLTPVVEFAPVVMKGNTIQKASIGSYARFMDLGLAKGDVIKIIYDIIPYVQFDENDPSCVKGSGNPIKAPKICPDCGKPLYISENGSDLMCINKDCVCRIKGKILNYCNKMGIEGISFATVDDFYNAGYLKKITDLYDLKKHKKELEDLDGYGRTRIRNILASIDAHRSVSYANMLGSIGITGISTKKFSAVMRYLRMDELIDFAKENNINIFTPIPGIQEKTAHKIIDGINENIKTINRLREELSLYDDSKDIFYKCVFTKVRDHDLEDWISEHGGEVGDSVVKDTAFVVIPNTVVSSSKIDKANKYGIPLVLIQDVKEYILKNFG